MPASVISISKCYTIQSYFDNKSNRVLLLLDWDTCEVRRLLTIFFAGHFCLIHTADNTYSWSELGIDTVASDGTVTRYIKWQVFKVLITICAR